MRFRVGYQIHPQHCTARQIREAYCAADSLGVDTLWVWDHMYPLYGDPDGSHYACLPILAAMAVETRNARFGALVHSNSYRNPELLAYDIATMDHLSGGRAILGIGAGWAERDYDEYGFEFGDAPSRLRSLAAALPRIKERWSKVVPPPGPIPIMIGGAGEKVTLKLTAQYADMWNTFPPADNWRRKNEILNEWCAKVGRDPAAVERTVSLSPGAHEELDELLDAGAQHVIMRGIQPFDMKPLEELLKLSGR
ncbi:MAG TPA: LLM class F420-dependent oxidoreductase [Candidatus Dormibacteraeota bacterium]|nr:LLM class F420-dependent oxidoreductase [Candidatus Dormibacteraeota bacterium]